MKTLLMIVCLLLSVVAQAQTDLEKTTLDINKQIVWVKGCTLFGGIAIVGGSVVNILAANKEVPKAEDYPDLDKYLQAVDRFEKKQKDYKVRSAGLYGLGGLLIIAAGVGFTQIELRSGRSVAITGDPAGVTLSYKF